jgi:hypothetical protein
MSLPEETEVPTNAGELVEGREIPEDGPNESPLRHHSFRVVSIPTRQRGHADPGGTFALVKRVP